MSANEITTRLPEIVTLKRDKNRQGAIRMRDSRYFISKSKCGSDLRLNRNEIIS